MTERTQAKGVTKEEEYTTQDTSMRPDFFMFPLSFNMPSFNYSTMILIWNNSHASWLKAVLLGVSAQYKEKET